MLETALQIAIHNLAHIMTAHLVVAYFAFSSILCCLACRKGR